MTNEETAQAAANELANDETFDLADVLNDVTYPTDKVTIYLKGDKTHELNLTLQAKAELKAKAAELAKEQDGIVPSEEQDLVDLEIDELHTKELALLGAIRDSALTFHMRGLAPEQWRVIIKQWEHKIKPATKSEEDIQEANNSRNRKINAEIIATSVIKTVNAKGASSKGAITIQAAEKLYDVLLESEYQRLLAKANQLTFTNSLFHNMIAADADFLSKS